MIFTINPTDPDFTLISCGCQILNFVGKYFLGYEVLITAM